MASVSEPATPPQATVKMTLIIGNALTEHLEGIASILALCNRDCAAPARGMNAQFSEMFSTM